MVYREGNQLLKILLVLVISVLLLTSIVYLAIVARQPSQIDVQDYLAIPQKSENQLNKDIDEYLIEIIDTETSIKVD